MTTSKVVYTLDNQDRIISVCGAWDKFADENSGINLSSKEVCGRLIWDFVTGDTTRMWLEAVFMFARARGTSIERPYRCDSPDLKRFMRMSITFKQGGVLLIEHEILATEQRKVPVYIHFGASNLKTTKERCSICGRVNTGGWKEPHAEHAEASGGINVVYTVCEDCRSLLPGT
jgi:hypothetical protein